MLINSLLLKLSPWNAESGLRGQPTANELATLSSKLVLLLLLCLLLLLWLLLLHRSEFFMFPCLRPGALISRPEPRANDRVPSSPAKEKNNNNNNKTERLEELPPWGLLPRTRAWWVKMSRRRKRGRRRIMSLTLWKGTNVMECTHTQSAVDGPGSSCLTCYCRRGNALYYKSILREGIIKTWERERER